MRVLVNALSVGNLSGRHVLLGHLSRLTAWTRGEHRYDVLLHSANRDICRDLGSNVSWQECPSYTSRWPGRVAWEVSRLPRLAATLKADVMFTPSGATVPGLSLPQVVLAQNPWALVPGIERGFPGTLKAAVQRHRYRATMNSARYMIFNSEYMRQAYRLNADVRERASGVVYQALDDVTHETAARMRETVARQPLQILCVSVMAPHKGVETLITALSLLRGEHRIPARLILAGPWPHGNYRNKVETQVRTLGLRADVTMTGYVSRQQLNQFYAESRVFALMSRCESFGIPAIEAQVFGTPVVSSDCCAIPEVCGEGGLYAEPGDASAAAGHIARLLEDDQLWQQTSRKARDNAARYRWDICSQGMLSMFDDL